MDTGHVIIGLLVYAAYELCKAFAMRKPKSRGEELAEALGLRVSSLEARIQKLEEQRHGEGNSTVQA